MSTLIRHAPCPACSCATAEWREAKAGAASFLCPDCKFQGFAKSPKAAAAVRSYSAPAATPAATTNAAPAAPAPVKKGGFLDNL